MQNRMQSNFKERSIYYLSRAIINQGRVGNEWKFEIKSRIRSFLDEFHYRQEHKTPARMLF